VKIEFLQQAIDLAAENPRKGGGPYGAVIVQNDQIIASSANLVTKKNDPTAHAEILAIRHACQKINYFHLTGCVLYSSCEPCPMCLGAIYWARLKKVYFACNRFDAAKAGFDDSFIYQEIQLKPEQRKIPMLQIQIADANKPFQVWSKSPEKIPY
jgi:guanine deaminase